MCNITFLFRFVAELIYKILYFLIEYHITFERENIMAIGWERGFILERDDTIRKRVNCKDCMYYSDEDKSCYKISNYIPDLGYDYWKQCKYFIVDVDIEEGKRYKAFLVKGVSALNRQKIDNPEKLINVIKGNGYYFYQLKEKYLIAFYDLYKKNKNINIMRCYEWLPVELYDGYIIWLKTANFDSIFKAMCLFMYNLEMPQLKTGMRIILKKVIGNVGEYVVTKDVRLTREMFENMFLKTFCEYLKERKAFEKFET